MITRIAGLETGSTLATLATVTIVTIKEMHGLQDFKLEHERLFVFLSVLANDHF